MHFEVIKTVVGIVWYFIDRDTIIVENIEKLPQIINEIRGNFK